MQLGLRFRGVLHAAALGKTLDEIGDQGGELLEVAAASPLRLAGETRHAPRHVGLKTDALLLAIVADIDACLGLLGDDVAHGAIHFIGELLFAEGLFLLAVNEHFRKRFVAREAANVGGQDTVATEDHMVSIMPFQAGARKSWRRVLTGRGSYVNFYAGC